MPDTSRIKALLLDVFGTVVDWRTGAARDVGQFLSRHAVSIDAFEFADAWRREYSPAMEEIRSGRRPFVRLDVLHQENLLKVLADYGVDIGSISADELDELNHAWHRLDPWPDSVEGLLRLKRQFIVAPLSNENIRLMLNMAKRAALPRSGIQTVAPSLRRHCRYSLSGACRGLHGCSSQRRFGSSTSVRTQNRIRRQTSRTRAGTTERPTC
jgi:2-haloacid dehalogenase